MNQDNPKGSGNEERRSSPIDRRSGKDRRKAYKLGYFQAGGVERRNGKEQRSGQDRRSVYPEEDAGTDIPSGARDDEES